MPFPISNSIEVLKQSCVVTATFLIMSYISLRASLGAKRKKQKMRSATCYVAEHGQQRHQERKIDLRGSNVNNRRKKPRN